jgi:DNA polymerase III delta subunit
MTPFFKLQPGWEKNCSSVLIIGPEGLISNQVINRYLKHHKHPIRRALVTSAQDCLELRESLATQSLFDEDEVWLIRLTKDNLLQSLKLSPTLQKKVIIFGVNKKPAKCDWIKSLSLVIQSYPLKEPYASKEVILLAENLQIKITPKAAKWVILCTQGRELLIPITLEKLQQIYGKTTISDEEVRIVLKQQSDYSPIDILSALTQCKSTLKLMIKSIEENEWASIYWILVSHWRKLSLCKENAALLPKQFPWQNQQKQAKILLNSYSQQEIQKQHQELIAMETSLKGFSHHSIAALLSLWLIKNAVN